MSSLFKLIKCSMPGWEKDFASLDDAVTELRLHICSDCLAGSPGFLNETVDTEIECRDHNVLLSTPCGLEYEIEEDPVWKMSRELEADPENSTIQINLAGAKKRAANLECDHVMPVARGGSSDLANLATACFPCNRAKRDKTLEEWVR